MGRIAARPLGFVRGHWPIVIACMVIVAASVFFAVGLANRTRQVDRLLFENCVANELQDAVIVAQLNAAKVRARASLPAGSPQLQYQMDVLNDGIDALEPPGERECKPPEGG